MAVALLASGTAAGSPLPAVAPTADGPPSFSRAPTLPAPGAAPDHPAPDAAAYQRIVAREAERVGLPPDLAAAVVTIESDGRPDRIGEAGEVGLMQVLPTTAAMLGFRGTAAALADPETNIRYGVAYLDAAWRLTGGDVCRTLMKYRAGHGSEAMSPLSVGYCQRARAYLAGIGSPLAAAITPADLLATATVAPAGGARPAFPAVRPGERLTVGGRFKKGPAFWAAFETRIKRINGTIEARWRRLASR